MDWSSTIDNTNTSILTDPNQSTMANFIKSAGIYKCPSDIYEAQNGERVRSVAMNGAIGLGSGPTAQGNFPSPLNPTYFASGAAGVGRAARKVNDLNVPGPANIFVILDEQGDSINDSIFMHDPGYSRTGEKWRDLPASYHNGAADFTFADGHSELHKWVGDAIYPVLRKNYGTSASAPWGSKAMRFSPDYEWLESRMPYQL